MKWSVDRIGAEGQGKLPAAGLVRLRMDSGHPGETVLIVSGVHGDELIGTAAIHGLESWLKTHVIAGQVVLLPCANPEATAHQKRHVPGDDRDLNRSFPGQREGKPSQQLAHLIWTTIESERPSVVVDLHSDSGHAVPYAILDRPVRINGPHRRTLESELQAIAVATGVPWFWEFPDALYEKSGLKKSLSGAIVNRLGIPAITLEIGPKGRRDAQAVVAMQAAVQRILTASSVTGGGGDVASPQTQTWCRASAPRNTVGGLFSPRYEPGETFRAGAVLGCIVAASGQVREEITANARGMVFSWNDGGWLPPGSFIGTLATPEKKVRR